MAANSDNIDHGAEGQWPFDPLLVPDNFDDVMHLLHVPGGGGLDLPGGLYSPPPAASMPNVDTGSYRANNPFNWTAMPSNGVYSSVDSSAPLAAGTAMAGPSTASAHHDVDASSSYVHQGALDCTGCQILREVLHSNGFEMTRLCIHGADRLFYHATLEVYHVNPEGLALAPTHQSFVDFMGRDYAWVKDYLTEYAQQQAAGCYTVVNDSTSAFHKVLCTSMAGVGVLADDRRQVATLGEAENVIDDQQFLANVGAAVQPMIEEEDVPVAASGPSQQNNAVQEQVQQVVRLHVKSRFTIQRERTRKLELHDISRYFHLTMVDACKELGICATVLKGIVRKFGIVRWPHRTIQRIDSQIAKLRKNGNGSAAAMDEIQKLNDSRRKIIMGDGP